MHAINITANITAFSFIFGAIVSIAPGADAQQKIPLPDVTVTAPANPPVAPPRSEGAPGNPYSGNYRVEETKWPDIPCAGSRIEIGAAGTCKKGPRMETFEHGDAGGSRQQSNCNIAHDLVMGTAGNLTLEAEVLVFDPYYVSGIGHQRQDCYVHATPGDLRVDFADMNQIARQGTGWRNFVAGGDQTTMEFTVGNDDCLAVQKHGPRWGGGFIWLMQFAVCRKDRQPVDAANVTTVLGWLQVRQYDAQGNLRAPPQ
jgi:hypothetical protein